MEELMGSIKLFAGNFAPRGYLYCQGQLLPIDQYTALFSILGTTYGGDGMRTFALPDLSGRSPIGPGNGPGLSQMVLGARGGVEQVSISAANMPNHSHSLNVSSDAGTTNIPNANVIAATSVVIERGSAPIPVSSFGATPNAQLSATAIGATGGNIPVPIRNPFLALNYIICTDGIYPSRN